ncbi:peptidoglycan DD-metalloendopeptidase family protein [Arenimonas terrae]|uniref:LysM peptidoglycan-binding domain-containing protein n=1 Tax=Arenimonas terrae TaxID=2546226 RepID=A0A5C4RW38_9GAMM|nr:peptidoglycan DD-metalloendopeptidase family protein [Arenimonas terrae]TNJ35185.1 LysM peptidoglycan-binding domain-containing protein [Arenimonas terrae]
MPRPLIRVLLLLAFTVLLSACGHSRVVKREGARPERPASSAPVRSAPRAERGDVYLVRQGDTMYGIAFRHGLDYREVAAWNRIPAPYTIYPGQRLTLRGPRAAAPAAGTSVTGMPASPRPGAPTPNGPAISRPLPPGSGAPGPAVAAGTPPVASPTPPVPAVVPGPANPAPVAGQVPVAPAPSSNPPAPVAAPVAPPSAVSASGWRWPAQGALVGRFVAGDPKRQGIDIAGNAGQPVFAAADGVVVYSGAGLVGYGELIIVKHSDEWLSAYAHNRRRLVTEGSAVKGGQQIAELGRSGTSRDMLHFEVRRNGKPVDPLQVLPPP